MKNSPPIQVMLAQIQKQTATLWTRSAMTVRLSHAIFTASNKVGSTTNMPIQCQCEHQDMSFSNHNATWAFSIHLASFSGTRRKLISFTSKAPCQRSPTAVVWVR